LQPTPAGHPQLANPGANYFLLVYLWTRSGKSSKYGENEYKFNKPVGTIYFVICRSNIVITKTFYYEVNYRRTWTQVVYCRNFVIKGVVNPRFYSTDAAKIRTGEAQNQGAQPPLPHSSSAGSRAAQKKFVYAHILFPKALCTLDLRGFS
jgi:hypothetical protein